MSRVKEQVAGVEFAFETGLDSDGVALACDRAAESRVRGGGGKFRELQRDRVRNGYAIHYSVRMGIGFDSARVVVTWSEHPGGGCRGHMQVPSFDTSQQKIFVFIPVSPKSVPALKVLRRFAESLRVELQAAPSRAPQPGYAAPQSGYAAPQVSAAPAQPAVAQPRPAPAGPSAAGTGSASKPAGWFPDPNGRHEHRYWDGAAWTARVSSGGVMSADPV